MRKFIFCLHLPEYRTVHGTPIGIFQNKFTGIINEVPLKYEPLLNQAKIDTKIIYERPITFSIPEMENYLKETELKEVRIEFTTGQLDFAQTYFDETGGWFLKNSYFKFPYSMFPQIISITQKKLIDYLLSIENELNISLQLDTGKFFVNGNSFDASVCIADVISKAKKEIILIDNYVNEKTLSYFSNKNPTVKIKILTNEKSYGDRLKLFEVNFNSQYKNLSIKASNAFHDRFLIIDKKLIYHIGASIKDAGKKAFLFSLIQDEVLQDTILDKFIKEWN